MLKGIPEILSPELLKVLCEMGHSDRLVIADGNFPVESMGKNAITIRCDGHGVPEILDAILKLFPLDTYVEHPVNLMEVMLAIMWRHRSGIHIKKSFPSMTSVAKKPSETSSVSHSMTKQKLHTASSPQVRKHFMPTSCFRKAL